MITVYLLIGILAVLFIFQELGIKKQNQKLCQDLELLKLKFKTLEERCATIEVEIKTLERMQSRKDD